MRLEQLRLRMVIKMLRCKEKTELTQDLLDTIAVYMKNDIREEVHFRFAPCKPEIFLREYIKRDPEFEELLYQEFGIEME